jgi:hypothetical protein
MTYHQGRGTRLPITALFYTLLHSIKGLASTHDKLLSPRKQWCNEPANQTGDIGGIIEPYSATVNITRMPEMYRKTRL